MAHNKRGVRYRHGGQTNTRARTSHGGGFDPTAATNSLYGSAMDLEPIGSPDYQGPIPPDVIPPGSIGSQHIQQLAILAGMLAENSVAQANLQDMSVGTEQLQVGSVQTDQLAAFCVTTEKILAGQITAELIAASGLLASQITAGTLSIGGTAGTPDILNLYNDAGELIGVFDENGVLLIDPDNQDLRMRFKDGVLEFTSDGSLGALATWSTAISAAGIRADSIQVGIAPGGHNMLPNSSFEVSEYSSGLSKTWSSTADFSGTIGTDVNVTAASNQLDLTVATY